MRRRVSTAWLLAAVISLPSWELVSGQSVQKPQLVPAVDQTVLQPGDTLTVSCRANRRIFWNGTSLDPNFRNRRITEDLDADGEFAYGLLLQIRDVSYLDVGYQRCHYVGDTDPDTAGSVYLFVNDTENLLVWQSKFIPVSLRHNQRGVIPCRPSHPGVKVTLMDAGGNEMSFDPTEGFIVPSPTLFIAGPAVCVARLGAVQRQLKVFVAFSAATDSVQQPRIDTSDARRNAVLGLTFSLECSVHVEVSQRLEFTWQVPPASTGRKTGRIVQYHPESRRDEAVSRLVVKDTLLEDAGNFTCLVEDHNGHTNNRTVHVPVFRSDVASVNLRTDIQSFSMKLGQTVKIVVDVESRPSPTITWRDPENREIITAVGKYNVVNTKDQTILEIFDLRLTDMGQYRVEAAASCNASNATDQLSFNVTVRDRARVQLAPALLYHVVGEQYRISCVATGYPPPSLEWRFEPCDSSLSCPPDDPETNVTRSNDARETQLRTKAYRVESDLTVTARHSGVYWCYASNDDAVLPTVGHHLFFVSDIADGFGIVRSNASVIEDDNVTMACGGSVMDFLSPFNLNWRWSEAETGPSQPVLGMPGVHVRDQTTEYSHRRVLVLDPVQMEHAGLLSCHGTDVRGERRSYSTWLRVTASQKPVFTAVANMDQSASLHVEEGDGTELNCTVTGQPAPQISWTKDGEPLVADGERVLLRDGDQRLEIATVLNSDAGSYECQAINREGTVRGSAELLVPEEDTMTRVVVPIVVAAGLLLAALIACLVWKCRQEKDLQKKLSALDMSDFNKGKVEQINPELPIDEQAALLPYAHDEWEFPKDRLVLGRQIGSGAFGRVLKAEAIGLTAGRQRTVVAVKMPRSGSDPDQIRSLMSELKIMIQLGKHLNVVNLLGAVTKHALQGEFMVLVEYCRHGNLHQYLHRHKNSFINQVHPISGEFDASLGEEEYRAAMRLDSTSDSCSYRPAPRRDSTSSSVHSAAWDSTDPTGTADDPVCQSPGAIDDERVRLNTLSSTNGGGGTAGRRPRRTPLTTRDLLRWSYQVARGMEYLASRKLLHGDLAARNVLLTEDNIVKISDFGLSRDIYKTKDYRKKGKGLLPVKWMAIESIQESLFSTQSDVWAFGVVLWELFSLGATPYPGMEYDNNFVRRLRDGYRMEMPKFSPQSAYRLMLDCWQETPGNRPSFTDLSEQLGQCLEEQVKKDYIQLNEPYQMMNIEYFARRVDYVNTLASPDYQNVSPRGEPLGAGSEVGSQTSEEPSAAVWLDSQAAGYTAPVKGVGPTPLVDSDSYLLVSPGPEQSPDSVFSPRPGAHFEFPPAPQLARESPPPHSSDAASTPNEFYNPSYHEAGRAQVPSTPKMGTRVSRPARPAAGAAEPHEEQCLQALGSSQLTGLLVGDGQHQMSAAETGDAHFRLPMPVGCEQLA